LSVKPQASTCSIARAVSASDFSRMALTPISATMRCPARDW
jgi:hypothetical protein